MAHGKVETDYTEDYIASKIIHTYFFIYYHLSNYLHIPVVTLGFWLHWFSFIVSLF